MAATSTTLISHIRRLAAANATTDPSDGDLLHRYADGHDEAAFSALVARHGPMVWRACRRVLRHEQDAEDVFQATFLVLARKAGAVHWRDSVAGWLYAVVTRLARKARAEAEPHAAPQHQSCAAAGSTLDDITARELLCVLDEQLAALPARYCDPLVLCCLERQTQEAAATQLGISHSTLRRRLERGRKLLHDRLARRGLEFSVALGALQLTQAPASAMPPALPASGRAVALVAALRPAGLFTLGKITVAVLLLTAAVAAGITMVPGQLEAPAVLAAAAPAAEPPDKPRLDALGDPLPAGAVARLGSLRLYHGLDLRRVVLSLDGKLVAGTDNTGMNRLWDAVTGRELPLAPTQVRQFIFAAQGKLLVAEGLPGRLLTDLATGKAFPVGNLDIKGLWQRANDIGNRETLSPDGKLIVVRGDKGLKLLNARYRKELPPLEDVPEPGALSATFSPDGKLLAVPYVQPNAEVWLWDVSTRKVLRKLKGQDSQIFQSVFSSDGKTLAAADGSGVTLWDVATGRRKHDWGHSCFIGCLAFTPDGRTLLTGSAYTDDNIHLWDPRTGKERGRWHVNYGVHGVEVTPDGKLVASGSWDGTIRLWDFATGKEVRPSSKGQGNIYTLALSPDGKTLASGGKAICLWDVTTGKTLRSFGGPLVIRLRFSTDGKTLASSAQSDRTVRLWHVATGKELFQLGGHESGSPCLGFSPDGRMLASGDSGGTIRLWDVANGSQLRTIDAPRKVGPGLAYCLGAIAFSPDGHTLAVGYSDQTVRLWEVATGRERVDFPGGHRAGIVSLAYSPDGKLLVSGAWDRTAVVWDVTGQIVNGRKTSLDAKLADSLWADLASPDAAKAFASVRALIAAEGTVRALAERLRPVGSADKKRVAKLIADLDSDIFDTRERAQRELVEIGDKAEPALRKAMANKPSAELLRRAERILARLDPLRSGEAVRDIRALEVLEGIGSAEARQVLERLAKGTDGARLTLEAKAAVARLGKHGRPRERVEGNVTSRRRPPS